jgi:plasmid stability protein
MATLTIRNVPDETHRLLRLRAARSGRSVEAEVRSILAAATEVDRGSMSVAEAQEWVDGLFAGRPRPDSAVDELIADRRADSAREEDEA